MPFCWVVFISKPYLKFSSCTEPTEWNRHFCTSLKFLGKYALISFRSECLEFIQSPSMGWLNFVRGFFPLRVCSSPDVLLWLRLTLMGSNACLEDSSGSPSVRKERVGLLERGRKGAEGKTKFWKLSNYRPACSLFHQPVCNTEHLAQDCFVFPG